ncbi:MAG: WecB/TagA/CpsF family glycosyltransferase, partial [Planctomycetota bacterium]
MIDHGMHNVLGIDVSAVDYEAAVAKVINAAQANQSLKVTALAVHGVMTGVLDGEHRYRLNEFDLVCPDGQPVRWALNLLHGTQLRDRVYGPNLTLEICRAAAKEDVPIFLFGATEEMLTQFSKNLQQQFDGLRIVGQRASKFRKINQEERDELVQEVRETNLDAQLFFKNLGFRAVSVLR